VHFHICLVNHGSDGRDSITDSLTWVQAGLEENGHQVTVSDTAAERGAINIFWEFFLPELAEQLVSSKLEYGIIATEIPDGTGFNTRTDIAWINRWQSFQTAAAGARFIWCMNELSIEAYSQFARTAYLEFGFTERLVPSTPRARPTYDFSFTGLPFDYRLGMLQALARRASVTYAGGIVSYAEQSGILRSGRVGLALKQTPAWQWPSISRIGRLVHESIPVAAEWTSVQIGVSRLVPQPAEGEDFVEFAISRLSLNLEAEAAQILERYRATPMQRCMARALEQTLG